MTKLKELWATFNRGEHLTDTDLDKLIASATQGAEYLMARGDRLATRATLMDLEVLQGYQLARTQA